MKKILISTFDMEVGGVERSLINMLENFDYSRFDVDVMLYRHTGDFMKLLPEKINLLKEISEYSTFRKSIAEIIKDKKYFLAFVRLFAKYFALYMGRLKGYKEFGTYQMQLMWKCSMLFLPKLDRGYDTAISYLWPHYFVAEKVKAKKKIAWIHTDFSSIYTNIKMDLRMWNKYDYLIAVSDECREAFLNKYPDLEGKTIVIENIMSPGFIWNISNEKVCDVNMKKECFNLVTVARLSRAKGIDNAVRALKLIHDRGIHNVCWYVIGFGGDESMINNLIMKNGLENNFIILGKKVNPYPYIKMCDLYVQPSRYEGKAVTVTEAQILGKPVLITDYPTARSQVKHEFNGYITELSVAGIANGIEKLYKDYKMRENLVNNCKKTDYSNDHELVKLYELVDNSYMLPCTIVTPNKDQKSIYFE